MSADELLYSHPWKKRERESVLTGLLCEDKRMINTKTMGRWEIRLKNTHWRWMGRSIAFVCVCVCLLTHSQPCWCTVYCSLAVIMTAVCMHAKSVAAFEGICVCGGEKRILLAALLMMALFDRCVCVCSTAAGCDWWCVLGSWSHSHGWETSYSAESSTITHMFLSLFGSHLFYFPFNSLPHL